MQPSNLVTRRHLQRTLLLSLCLSALLLLSAVLVAFRTVHQVNSLTSSFAERQAAAKDSISAIEREQTLLNMRWRRLARKDVVRREEILEQSDQNREQMNSALESAYGQADLLRKSLYSAGHGLLRWTVWLFALCVALSFIGATWAVRTSANLFRQLEGQSQELTRLQYAFLESQENTARRFSHELHDELGQGLTAIKANLSALSNRPESGPSASRIDDCMALVDTAIHNVREMSQLLRPTVLDDFGLDAAMRALTERFAARTGLSVQYNSTLDSRRLRDETETHLYRIAQEALTNVSRHASASVVDVALQPQGANIELLIDDNGEGQQTPAGKSAGGLGLAGMRTRARACGGDLTIRSQAGQGFHISVVCPMSLAAGN